MKGKKTLSVRVLMLTGKMITTASLSLYQNSVSPIPRLSFNYCMLSTFAETGTTMFPLGDSFDITRFPNRLMKLEGTRLT